MMRQVVVNGTARRIFDTEGYEISGKTGSAEYSSNKSLSHAWFTGFAGEDDPEIAVTVIVEGGGSGVIGWCLALLGWDSRDAATSVVLLIVRVCRLPHAAM